MNTARLLRKALRPVVPAPCRDFLRQRVLGEVKSSREAESYATISALGADSENEWIRKSATIGGWLFEGEHEVLWELASAPLSGDILEIGSWMGKSSCLFAGACIEHLPKSRVFCVDPFDLAGTEEQRAYHERLVGEARSTFDHFRRNAETLGYASHVVPIAARSDQALSNLKLRLRLAFIDGAHDYDSVATDVELALPMIEPGGLLVLHDCDDPHWPDVGRYVEERLVRHPELREELRFRSLAVFRKRSGVE